MPTMSNSRPSFAQSQLEKYGWREGKGLGREEGGITEALKPNLKFNSTGLGYDVGEQFKFHWWDHVFNKAADNITVGKDQSGSVQLKHAESLEVSTKRLPKNKAKSKFYGTFVKGATLMGENEQSPSDSSDEEEEKDRSLRLSDEELFKICKGRTAHKGARHGLNMTAKLARVKAQELLLMQAWAAAESEGHQDQHQLLSKKKKKKEKKSSKNKDEHFVEPQSNVKHSKKRKHKATSVLGQDGGREECVLVELQQDTDAANPLKKKKKSKVTDADNTELCDTTTTKKKKKKPSKSE